MKRIGKRAAWASPLLGMFAMLAATPVLGQEEQLPTLKLNRIAASPAFIGQTRAPMTETSNYVVETVVAGLSRPWALAVLPGGDLLINENTGSMRILDTSGELSSPLTGLPEISLEGWAGLFDVALDPNFTANHLVYFSYAGMPAAPGGPNIARIARGRLEQDALRITGVEIILEGNGRQEIHFDSDGKLLVSGAGEEFDGAAQDLSTTYGKLVRINPDGSIPDDNPWSSDPNVPSEIYTYGHRDLSGFATHPETGEVWFTEHGPRGGDELNIVRSGANYGWDVISYGTQYSGKPVGKGHAKQAGMEQPRYFWRPSIAPSGLMFYTGDMFPEWRGSIFVTALSGQHLTRLVLDEDRVIAEERFLVEKSQRTREVRQGSDGSIYVLTNEEPGAPTGTAELLRISRRQR